jgi:hypothetical protein
MRRKVQFLLTLAVAASFASQSVSQSSERRENAKSSVSRPDMEFARRWEQALH